MRNRLVVVWRLLRTEHGWSRVWVSLGMAITMAGGGLIYYQTTGGGDDPLQFPNPSTTGVPAGWTPVTTTSTDILLDEDNEVLEDVRLTNGAKIEVTGQNVTIRRVELLGGWINNQIGGGCGNGLLIEDVTITTTSPGAPHNDGEGVISYGGYTARRVEINDRSEGFRISAPSFGCGPAVIEDSYAKITPPTPCGDWHGDGIQSFLGNGLTVDNMTIDMTENDGGTCYGTAPVWYPDGEDGSFNHLLVMGMGYSFRMHTPGSVTGLRIVNDSWVFGPTEVSTCAQIDPWEAKLVEIDSNYLVTSEVADQPCE